MRRIKSTFAAPLDAKSLPQNKSASVVPPVGGRRTGPITGHRRTFSIEFENGVTSGHAEASPRFSRCPSPSPIGHRESACGQASGYRRLQFDQDRAQERPVRRVSEECGFGDGLNEAGHLVAFGRPNESSLRVRGRYWRNRPFGVSSRGSYRIGSS